MLSPSVIIRGLVGRRFPQLTPDSGPNQEAGLRVGRDGAPFMRGLWPTDHLLADQGSLMQATMLPGATALQLGLSAAFSATAAAIVVQNIEKQGNSQAKRSFLKYIRFVVSIPPTAGTTLLYASVIDDAVRTPTTISSGTGGVGPGTPATATAYKSLITCTNMDETPNIVTAVYFPLSTAAGAPPAVPGAGQNARTIVGNGLLRAQIPVLNDVVTIQFGGADMPGQSLVTAAPAGASRIVEPHPAVVLGPQQFFLLHLWSPSNITAGLALSGLEVGVVEE